MRGKFIVSAIIAIFVCTTAYCAKPIEFGVKGGVTWQDVGLRGASSENYEFHASPRMGMQIGVVGRINLPLIHIQPELLYSMNRYELNATPKPGHDVSRSRSIVKMNSFELPILVGIKLLFIRINAGPVFNLTNEASVKSKSTPHSVNYVKSTISYMAGVGVDLGKISIDARYNGQFKKPLQSIQIFGDTHSGDYRSTFRNWAFSVGYMF